MLWFTLLIALVAAAAAGTVMFYADRKRSVPYPLITAALRGLLVLCTVFLLLAPDISVRDTHTRKPVVLLLQDNSSSITAALGKDAGKYQQDMEQLLRRLKQQYQVVTWSLQGNTDPDSLFRYSLPSTPLGTALISACDEYSQQNLGAVILATDGRYNDGPNPLYTTLPANTSLYTVAIGDTSRPHDLRVGKIYANKSVALNSQFEIRADILASGCSGYNNTVSLKDAGGNTIATTPLSISNDRFDGSVSFSVKAAKAGLQQYQISLPADADEPNTGNNKASVFVTVTEQKKKILLLAAAPHPDIRAITAALEGMEQYELTLATELPADLGIYSCLVLHNLPAMQQDITRQLQQSGKSTWYITGAQNNFQALNQLQNAVRFQSAGYTLRDADPVFQASFSQFSLPADIRAVSDRLPPLAVPAGMITASATANALFSQADGQPLWVLQPGKTPVAILCGEGLWRWRMYEYKYYSHHNTVDECIRQTIGFLTANNNEKPFRAEMPGYVWHYPAQVTVNAYLYNSNNEAINQPEATLHISDSAGRTRDFSFERNGSTYRLNMGTLLPGTYRYTARTIYNSKTYTDEGSFVVDASSVEAQESGCDYPLLYTLARRNSGQVFPAKSLSGLYDSLIHNKNIRPQISEQMHTAPLVDRKWFFFLILLLATIEWLLRKYWMAM